MSQNLYKNNIEAAKRGDAEAQKNVGKAYYSTGKGVAHDYSQAVYWFRKAAEQGDAEAQFNLGACYELGLGVKQDYTQAVYWYRKAAEKEDSGAQNNLGVCYKEGHGVDKDYSLAAYWYRKAAEKGDISAQNNLGICYEKGDGVKQNYSQAVYWYRKAAEQGKSEAQRNLALCYEYGKGVIQNYTQAFYWNHKAAEQGDTLAQNIIGANYGEGKGVKQDLSKSAYWFKKAAEQGSCLAQNFLSFMYYIGQGVKQDYYQAVFWAKKAAEKGESFSQNLLGACYGEGHGVDKDDTQAVYWYRKAAEQGNSDAQNNLAICYKEGRGVDKDYSKAIYWYRKAAEQGLPAAIENLAIAEAEQKEQQNGQQHSSSAITPNAVAVDIDIPKSQKRDENTYAVVIGNEKYKNESDVPYALNDARVFYQYVTKTLGVPENQVQLKENASLNEIKQCVKWLTMAMDASSGNGKIIFYYAGHGIPDEATQSSYLLPVDGMGSDVEYAYSLESLYSELSKMPSDRIMVFLDACFSGAKRNGQLMNSARGVAIKAKASRPKGNMIVFSAAQGDETAYPYDDCQHGMFTYFLLKKIQETEGNVTLGDLSEFLTKSVKMQSSRNNEKNQVQTPTVNVSPALKKAWMKLQLKQ